jgi:hypothetical protein
LPGAALFVFWALGVGFGFAVPRFGCVFAALAFPFFASGLLVLPLCGAALTFFAAAKKVSKESGLQPLALKWVPRLEGVVVHLESVFSRTPRW